jgi:ABC-type protease/lipase transport system fused ATPase/permease subunit
MAEIERSPLEKMVEFFLRAFFLLPIWVVIVAMVTAVVIPATRKASEALTIKIIEEESSAEWQAATRKTIGQYGRSIENIYDRCGSQRAVTIDLVYRHNKMVGDYQRAIMRFAHGSQYRGVEEGLPKSIRVVDCGKMHFDR